MVVFISKEVNMLKKIIKKSITKPVIIELIFAALYTCVIASIPYMNKLLFDIGFSGGYTILIKLVIIYFCLIVSSFFLQKISQTFEWKVIQKFSINVKDNIFRAIYSKKSNEYFSKDVGEYVSIINNNIKTLMVDYIDPWIDIFKSLMMLVIYAIVIFVFIDYRIAITILISSLISIFVPKLSAKKLSNKKKTYMDKLGKYTANLTDFLSGYKGLDYTSKNRIMEIHKCNIEDTENSKFEFGKFNTFVNVLNGFVMDFITMSAFVVVGILYIKGEISIGTGVSTFGYIECFIYPIKYILNDINYINSSKEVYEDIEELLKNGSYALNEDINVNIDNIQTIRFENVSVKRGDFKLSDFNYTFKKGNSYALIGHSGSGKSTVIELLSGAIKPDSGKIYINDIDVTGNLDVISSKFMSVLMQHQHIFASSYNENVSNFGAYNLNNLKNIESKLPQSMIERIKNTKSDDLSGGEKQLVGLIKSMLSNKKVFLYDESFAAIDKENLKTIYNLLDNERLETRIEVTHDISLENMSRFDYKLNFAGGKLLEI